MQEAIQRKWFRSTLKRLFTICVLALLGALHVLGPPAGDGPYAPFGLPNAHAQAINPQAKSKYDAGVAAMNRGDCAGARTLLQQAIALDPTDRSVRVGMFSTDYLPNAMLKALEAKCGPSAPTAAPGPGSTPAPTPAATPLAIQLVSPQGSALTVQYEVDSTRVQGSVQGGTGGFRVSVNGKDVAVDGSGRFSTSVPLNVGVNDISIRVLDSSNKEAAKNIRVTRLAQAQPAPATPVPPTPGVPPSNLEIVLVSPTDSKISVPAETENVEVKGAVKGGAGKEKVFVNGRETRVESNGSFSAVVAVKTGANRVIVKATDTSGATREKQLVITRAAAPPAPAAPLALNLTSPTKAEQAVGFETDKITVGGAVTGGQGTLKVTINNKPVTLDKRGTFSTTVPLAVGENTLHVRAADASGKEETRELRVTRAAKVFPPPALTVTSPEDPRQSVPFEMDKLTVKGAISGGEGVSKLTINDKDVRVDAKGAFAATVALETGENRILVRVRDAAGREDSRELWITRQAKVYPPPALTVSSPAEPRQTVAFETDSVTVKGMVSGGEGNPLVTVNDREVRTDARGGFAAAVPLETGENRLMVKVRDAAGREDVRELWVTRQAKVYPPPSLVLTAPSDPAQSVPFETESLTLTGMVSGGEGTLSLTVNDREVRTDARGGFSTTVPLQVGENRVIVTVRDAAGREERRDLRLTRLAKVYPPPGLTVTSPADSTLTVPFETETLTVKGSLSGGEGTVKLTVNDKEIRVAPGGAFSAVVPLHVGENRIAAKALDSVGREDSKSFLVTRRPDERGLPLTLTVEAPTEKGDTGGVTLSGRVTGGKKPLKVIVDGRTVPIDERGEFATGVTLRTGKNRILVRVEDAEGKHQDQLWFLFHYPTGGRPRQ